MKSESVVAFRVGDDGVMAILDQRALPEEVRWWRLGEGEDVVDGDNVGLVIEEAAQAIETLAVRGAPAIGGAAAVAIATALKGRHRGAAADEVVATTCAWLKRVDARLRRTRPTAVNLFVALDAVAGVVARFERTAASGQSRAALVASVCEEAQRYVDDDIAACRAMGDAGAATLEDGDVVITICHTGSLATCGQGTALGVVKSARRAGLDVGVVALETRPLLQGARLTAWECLQEQIPITLISDGMAGFALARGIGGRRIRRAFVGADRVALNGDAANKIGTYQLALACHAHNIPFHVVAPRSTFDLGCPNGGAIPIEERAADEVRHARGRQTAPLTVPVWNPAFDVTPASLVTSWITERGLEVPGAAGFAA